MKDLKVEGESTSPFRVTDILGATISFNYQQAQSDTENSNVYVCQEMIRVYNILNEFRQSIRIIKILNKLNTGMRNVTLNFIWQNKIIGEIQLIMGQQHPNTYQNSFLKQLSLSNSVHQFKEIVLLEVNQLSSNYQIYQSNADHVEAYAKFIQLEKETNTGKILSKK